MIDVAPKLLLPPGWHSWYSTARSGEQTARRVGLGGCHGRPDHDAKRRRSSKSIPSTPRGRAPREKSLDRMDAELIRAVFEFMPTLRTWSMTRTPRSDAFASCSSEPRTEKTDAVVGHTADSQDGAGSSKPSAEDSDEAESDDATRSPPRKAMGDFVPLLIGMPSGLKFRTNRSERATPVRSASEAHSTRIRQECWFGSPDNRRLEATVYELEKLRCHLCGRIFTAQAPEAAGADKYDPTVASMIGLLKYGNGLPFNRLDGLQENLGIPLPASTQWDIVAEAYPQLQPAHEELIRQAAQGEVLFNDDTTVKILELMGERAKAAALAESGERRTTPRVIPTARVCSPRAWWPRVKGVGSRCSSAADGMRARTCKRCCVGGRPTCRLRSRCVTRCRAIVRGNCKRSWPIAWRMPVASSSTSTSASRRSAATCWKRSRSSIATTSWRARIV